jgi:hypothetical protein
MSIRLRWSAALLVAASSTLVWLPAPALAQKKPKPDPDQEKKEKQAQEERYVKDLMLAYRLKDLGYDKDRPAPEMLIAAARLFRQLARVSVAAEEQKPKVKGEGPAVDEAVKPPDLEQQAKELLRDAADIAATLKLDVASLIKDVQTDNLTRAVYGGPRQITRKIGPGQMHIYEFTIAGPTVFAVRGTIPIGVSAVHVWDGGQHTWLDGVGPLVERIWTPNGPCKMVITIGNVHKHPAAYQLFIN